MSEALESKLNRVEFPTLGHFLEDGFLPPAILPVSPTMHMVGRARTVRIPDFDAAAVNQAILRIRPGEVLVIDMGSDDPHACVGAVTITAITAAGAAGVLVNGLITDLDDLTDTAEGAPTPVFARGSSPLTTKRQASNLSEFDVVLDIAGTPVHPGDWVLGDRNGVVVASDTLLGSVIDDALSSDAAEPDILARIRSGEPLSQILYFGE